MPRMAEDDDKMTWKLYSSNGIFEEGEFTTLDDAIEAVEKERKQVVSLVFKASGLYAEAKGKKSGKLVEVALFRNAEATLVKGITREIEIATRDRTPIHPVEETFGQLCDRMSRCAGW